MLRINQLRVYIDELHTPNHTGRINEEQYKNTERLCGNIRRLLIASCSTAKGINKNGQ